MTCLLEKRGALGCTWHYWAGDVGRSQTRPDQPTSPGLADEATPLITRIELFLLRHRPINPVAVPLLGGTDRDFYITGRANVTIVKRVKCFLIIRVRFDIPTIPVARLFVRLDGSVLKLVHFLR